MIRIRPWGDVTGFLMGRSMGPVVPYTVHAFLVGDTLIDTGTTYACSEFMYALGGRSINAVINTHHHEDHTGNNALLQKMSGSVIYAHEKALPFLAHPHMIRLKFYQRMVWGYPGPSLAKPLGGSLDLPGRTFRVIHTPGHSPDHVCLLEPGEGRLFTGDLFCGKTVRYLRRDEDFPLILSSLKRLTALDFADIFCSLKGMVRSGRSALRTKIEFMEELQGRALALHRKGLSSRKIRSELLGREGAMYYLSSAHFSKQHVIDSILAGEEKSGGGA